MLKFFHYNTLSPCSNQSSDQYFNASINASINVSINASIHASVNASINPPINPPINTSMFESIPQEMLPSMLSSMLPSMLPSMPQSMLQHYNTSSILHTNHNFDIFSLGYFSKITYPLISTCAPIRFTHPYQSWRLPLSKVHVTSLSYISVL